MTSVIGSEDESISDEFWLNTIDYLKRLEQLVKNGRIYSRAVIKERRQFVFHDMSILYLVAQKLVFRFSGRVDLGAQNPWSFPSHLSLRYSVIDKSCDFSSWFDELWWCIRMNCFSSDVHIQRSREVVVNMNKQNNWSSILCDALIYCMAYCSYLLISQPWTVVLCIKFLCKTQSIYIHCKM